MTIDGRADNDQVADMRVAAECAVAKRKHATQAPAVQRQILHAGMLANLLEKKRHEFGNIGIQVVVRMLAARNAPINQINLIAAGEQIFDEAAIGEQVINAHFHGEGRHDDHGHAMAAFFHLQCFTIERNAFIVQWCVVAQLDQAIVMQYLIRRLIRKGELFGAQETVAGIA